MKKLYCAFTNDDYLQESCFEPEGGIGWVLDSNTQQELPVYSRTKLKRLLSNYLSNLTNVSNHFGQ